MLRAADFIFRPLVIADAPAWADAVRSSMVTLGPWMPWAHPDYTESEALEWIDWCRHGWEQRSGFEFGIFDADGTLLGGCGLAQFNRSHCFCSLGYWVRASAQRRGAAVAAIGALSRFAFAELGLGRVEIPVAVGNTASLGAARKAGAVLEGVARNRLKLGERFVDAHVLSLLPSGVQS